MREIQTGGALRQAAVRGQGPLLGGGAWYGPLLKWTHGRDLSWRCNNPRGARRHAMVTCGSALTPTRTYVVTCVGNTSVNDHGRRPQSRAKGGQSPHYHSDGGPFPSPNLSYRRMLGYVREQVHKEREGSDTRGRQQYSGEGGGSRKGEHAEGVGGRGEQRGSPDLWNMQEATRKREGAGKWDRKNRTVGDRKKKSSGKGGGPSLSPIDGHDYTVASESGERLME